MGKSKSRSLLVLRFSAMGDVAMTIPVLLAFRKKYPDIPIRFVTRPFFGKIVQLVPGVEVIPVDLNHRHKGILGIWRLSRELSDHSPLAVADLHGVLRTHLLKLFTLFSSFPFRQINKGRAGKKALTAPVKKQFTPLKTTFERYTEVFRKLGYPLELSPKDVLGKQPLPQKLPVRLQGDPKKWVGIAPFAAFPGKEYPLANMEKVVRQLDKDGSVTILLFGGGSKEKELLDQWESKYDSCINLVGSGAFEDELALVSRLDLMVAMDSGNAHLAAMFGVPTLTLWGVTHPYAGFYPFGQEITNALMADRKQFPQIPTSVYGKRLPKGYERAMDTISPQAVLQKIRELLDE